MRYLLLALLLSGCGNPFGSNVVEISCFGHPINGVLKNRDTQGSVYYVDVENNGKTYEVALPVAQCVIVREK